MCHCGVTWGEYETGPYTADLSSYIIILLSIVLRASHTLRKYSTVFTFCVCVEVYLAMCACAEAGGHLVICFLIALNFIHVF